MDVSLLGLRRRVGLSTFSIISVLLTKEFCVLCIIYATTCIVNCKNNKTGCVVYRSM